MDRNSALSRFDPINTSFDEDIKSIIYYLASQADKSEWSLDKPWDLSKLIISLIRRTPTMAALGKWVYREIQSVQQSSIGLDYPFVDIESATKKEGAVDTVFQKLISGPQILKASLSKREIILQSLRPLSGRETVLDKLTSGLDGLKTNIAIEKHKILGRLNEKEERNSKKK